jgi:ABC-type multidrug transport system permease subunit
MEAKCNCYDFMAIKQSVVYVEMRRNSDRVAAMVREKGFEVSVFLEELPVVFIFIFLYFYIFLYFFEFFYSY